MAGSKDFTGVRLPGGFVLAEVRLASAALKDSLGRSAVAQTRIIGCRFHLSIQAGLSDLEQSVTMYHEVLEAATVASPNPPATVADFNEADFERAAWTSHQKLGPASPKNLERMLHQFGFGGM